MTSETELGFCGWACWIIGVIAGIFAYLMSHGAVGWLPALLVGLAVAIFLGLVLRATFCKSAAGGDAGTVTAGDSAEGDSGVATAAMAAGGASAVAAGSSAEADDAAARDAAARAAAQKAEAEKSAEAKVQTGTYKAAEPEKAAKPKAEPAKAKTPKKAPAAKPAAKAPEADAAEKKPRTMKAPRKAGADDLKLISGVGPKLEATLNELGFWHFDQIADWGAEEIAWVDSRLRFKGRIARDDWMSQAKVLAEGGETEFSKKKKG